MVKILVVVYVRKFNYLRLSCHHFVKAKLFIDQYYNHVSFVAVKSVTSVAVYFCSEWLDSPVRNSDMTIRTNHKALEPLCLECFKSDVICKISA